MNDDQTEIYDELSSSVELLFTAQHRVFLFMILVMGRRFRILRWDRAGVISTPPVDYFEQPTIACDYLYHLCRLGDDSLGFDPTATRLRPNDVDFLRMDVAALPDAKDVDHSERDLSEGDVREPFTFAYIRSLFRTSLDCDWPRHRLVVQDGGQKHDYLVGKPTFHASGTMGRGTRGYVAYECSSRRFVWLKDAWRASYKITDREGDILAKLNAAKVTNVPTLVCHGDVNNQTTITADWWERQSSLLSRHASRAGSSRSSSNTSSDPISLSGRKRKRAEDAMVRTLPMQSDGSMPHAIAETTGPLRQHTHYRVVMAEVCLPLKIFQYGQQLVSIVLDCIRAHHQVSVKPTLRLLHCDISSGNILIYPKVIRDEDGTNPWMVWTGILSDWEMSKPIDAQEAPSGATRANRMSTKGTYQFMSVNLLSDLSKPVKVSDELESFLHVLLYYSVRYLQSNCSSVTGFIKGYFDTYAGPDCQYTCGQKSVTMQSSGVLQIQRPYMPLQFFSPMDNILITMVKCFAAHYKVLDHEARKARPHRPPPRCDPPSPRDDGDKLAVLPDSNESGSGIADVDWDNLDDDLLDSIPTPEELQLASKVTTHDFMLDYLAEILHHQRWRLGDRITPAPPPETSGAKLDGDSLRRSVAIPTETSTGNKRLRTKGPERGVSLPARLHSSTRRSRPRPRTLPMRARS
ncbi:hypothetical protein DICSQDRAFT_174936 [Dichomitus squalens LYAD-421 SS1]|uniref:Fungal-type protein kinase domain-containing protein n=1 Tax=Dichomitus squalens (strain LYAD-421) TaxID=732165 RepID=R7SL03_DICSQ|nr:uncharacterized protein DICSQDRAFT_174936 [Dichomitus squalens LYAD-421 SS1]EJF56420.1 hypothetical protein DICSQDRAFT_174936 [Dichomitus squalens LYAD-421 SS1]